MGCVGRVRAGGGEVAWQGEGGHRAFSSMTERELEVLSWVMQRYENGSTDRVVSGMGLENLYMGLCALDCVTAQALSPERRVRGVRPAPVSAKCGGRSDHSSASSSVWRRVRRAAAKG